jgi:branched-chain amino acid transport system substrate-binding protein
VDGRAEQHRRRTRSLAWFVTLTAVVTLVIVAAGCGGGGDDGEAAPAEAAPAETAPAETGAAETAAAETGGEAAAAPGECSIEGIDDGVINVFATADAPSAAIGENIGPAAYLGMSQVWVDDTNAAGGILGCQIEFNIEDDTFDIPTCTRLYRDALASNEYDFFIGPTNSGCMAGLSELTGAANKWLFSGVAADHQPFMENFATPYVSHSSVSTFLEGSAVAKFASEHDWQRVALMVPNYAYGQDVGKSFTNYYQTLVPDGQIVNEQFPEFDEDNFTPFINAMVGADPDGIVTAFFSSFILPFMSQWSDSGNAEDIEVVSGLVVQDMLNGITSESEIPPNFYGFDRGNWQLLANQSAVAENYVGLFQEQVGDQYPIPDSFTFQLLSTWQMAKALLEETQTIDPEAWRTLIESGEFGFEGPYREGLTYVNPVNHMSDTCASVGQVIWDDSLPVPATLDPDGMTIACMSEVIPMDQVRQYTDNPDVSDEALARHYELTTGGGS